MLLNIRRTFFSVPIVEKSWKQAKRTPHRIEKKSIATMKAKLETGQVIIPNPPYGDKVKCGGKGCKTILTLNGTAWFDPYKGKHGKQVCWHCLSEKRKAELDAD